MGCYCLCLDCFVRGFVWRGVFLDVVRDDDFWEFGNNKRLVCF